MRIRKNRRITPLLFPNASADGKPQPYRCSLNQSVWDVISVSPKNSRASPPPPLHLLQQAEVGDDESGGNGIRSLHDDIIEVEESGAVVKTHEVMKSHEVIPIEDSDDESTESDNQIELEKTFNGRATTRGNNLLIGWPRGQTIDHRYTTRRTRAKTNILPIPIASKNKRKHISPLSPRASRSTRAKKINSNDFYSRSRPRRNKKTKLEHANERKSELPATEKPTRKSMIEKKPKITRINSGHSFVSKTNMVVPNVEPKLAPPLLPSCANDSGFNNVKVGSGSSRYGIEDYSNMIRWVCIDESDNNNDDGNREEKDSDRDYSDSEVKRKIKRKRKVMNSVI